MANKFFTKILTAGCALSLLFTSNVFASNLAKVTADAVYLRSYNSTQGHVVGTVIKDDTLRIVANANNGWFEVSTSDGTTGFISEDYMQINQTDATCIEDNVNVRTSPSTSSTILGKAKNGDVFVTSGVTGDWYIIKYNNTTGYINKQYMQGTLLKYLPTVAATDTASVASTNTVAKAVNINSGDDVYAVVDASSLNLRSTPDMESDPIKALPEGYTLTVLGYQNGWIKVVDDTDTTGYVSAKYITLKNGTKPNNVVSSTPKENVAKTSTKASNSKGSQIIEYGKNYIGTPYVWGGTDLQSGVDCSGFVYSCYKHFGINLLRTSREMFTMGEEVDRDSLQPGDLVFFNSGGDTEISHVGMYVGDDEYIHSTNGSANGVTISDLNSSYAVKTYVGAKRILQ